MIMETLVCAHINCNLAIPARSDKRQKTIVNENGVTISKGNPKNEVKFCNTAESFTASGLINAPKKGNIEPMLTASIIDTSIIKKNKNKICFLLILLVLAHNLL